MHDEPHVELSVSEFVGLLNQNLEYSFSGVTISGELANLRVSKNRWVYFDLKDDYSTVKFFGTIYNLPGPLEEGMMLRVKGQPKLHNLYGFSVNVQKISLAGEGSIKRAAELLKAQLLKEGLFDSGRKRTLPYPPQKIGLIASEQSAAYADFIKIINARFSGLEIYFIDVQVQGEPAPQQITKAIESFNEHSEMPEVLVVIRGGGSAEDLAAFNTELVTRAVAASRIPTLVAIGHEIDISLAELAADCRASTPSNAAELLTPDKKHLISNLANYQSSLESGLQNTLNNAQQKLASKSDNLQSLLITKFDQIKQVYISKSDLLEALSPHNILQKGYAIIYKDNRPVSSVKKLRVDDKINIVLGDGKVSTQVNAIEEI
ncbi:exodeoxyribonuclease VII large subunit [bacterium]|jgi:exodeoxyribonuclease VII large subunit|nr:exodeoxyribonuclease VII large subunit [bacterium]